ncbi:MAG: fibronectin type III domain-containing protein [Candidatus Omnitrophota bacterium]|jgi:hypothetical protein|nr:MAG: fibronectin type III domain-containing protein [Candidatus Omnitrophota bacterium]
MRAKKIVRISLFISLSWICFGGFQPIPVYAQSFDLSDILNGNVSGTYEKIEVTNVANTASLVLENITINVDITTSPPTVTSITLESGTFTYAGLEASITEATYDASAKEFTATASLAFPESVTVSVQFSISQSGVKVLGGRINLPDFEVGNVGVKNGYVEYFPEDDKLGGGADITVPGLGADPENPASIAGSIEVHNGKLTMFSVSADGLKIPLGDTDAFLNSIGVEGDHLDNVDQMTLTGTMGIVGGPEVGDVYTFEVDTTGTITPAHGWIDITGTSKLYGITTGEATFSYRPPYNISIGAEANFEDIFIASFSAGIDSSGVSGSAEGKLQIPGDVPIVGGYTMADAKASLHNTDFSGSVSITLTPEVPEICTPQVCTSVPYWYPCPSWSHPLRTCSGSHDVCTPEICTPSIPAVKASVGFTYSNGKFSFSTKQERGNSWEIPYNQSLDSKDGNARIRFMTNWSRIDKVNSSASLRTFAVTPAGEPVTVLSIAGAIPAAIFRITYSNSDVSAVNATLTLPGGEVLVLAEGALPTAFTSATGFSRFNPDAREAYFFLDQPGLGNYTVTLENVETLGEYSVELLAQNHEPRIEIIDLRPTDAAGVYRLDWIDEDPDDNAIVRVSLDTDRKNENGYLLAVIEEDEETNSILLDTNTANVHPGYYYVFITVDDGKNARAVSYSSRRIWVDNGRHPQSVTQIAVGSGDGEFTVQWDYENIADVKYFTILYTEDDTLSVHDNHVTVARDARSYTVKGLKNGVPLLTTVLAVDERGYCSAPVSILRVVPSPGFGYTPPVIVSKPDIDATVGSLYFYLPKLFDADTFPASHPNANADIPVSPIRPLFTWELLDGPEGMTIVPAIGLITWTPSANQVGDHHVVIQVTELVYPETDNANEEFPIEENVAVQEFTIVALPLNNTNGVEFNPYEFFSTPQLFAYEKTLYQYDVAVLAPADAQIDYFIAEGPEGMMINEIGTVMWEVPAGAAGEFVNITAVINGEFFLEQCYFLHVATAKNTIGFPSAIQNFPWQSLQ